MNRFITHNKVLLVAFCGVLLVLVCASVVCAILKRRKPGSDYTELKQRIRTWWVIASAFVFAIALGRGLSSVFFALISFLALKEYFSLISVNRVHRRVLLWAYCAIAVQYWWVYTGWYGMFIIFIPVYMFLLLGIRLVMVGETEGFLRSAGVLHWGLMTTVFSLSHVAFLLVLPGMSDGRLRGAELVFYLVFLTQINDVAQYIWGKSFGKMRIVPSVSPNKTLAGFVGGVGTTVVLGCLLARWFTPMDIKHSVFAGLIIGLGGFMGDVTILKIPGDCCQVMEGY
jgi:phosphatidate cytidylyltransferase